MTRDHDDHEAPTMASPEANLRAAEEISRRLAERGFPAVVIGAIAMAVHNYVRLTEDIDLGVVIPPADLRAFGEELSREGYRAEFRAPDADDPLGGVLDISGPFGMVQVVSFADRFPRVIEEALRSEPIAVRDGSPLRAVPLPHLIALKLYAGGAKSRSDIVELIRRNPEADREEIRQLCKSYRLRGIDTVLREIPS